MEEIRARVAEKKARGAYTLDALASDGAASRTPFQPDVLAELGRLVEINPNLALARSNRRGFGALIGKAKSALTRATSQPLLDATDQASAFNALLLAYVVELGAEVERLRGILDARDAARQPEER